MTTKTSQSASGGHQATITITEPVEDTIHITVAEYKRLKDSSEMLEALEQAGVDNWVGYDEAQDIYLGWEQENR